MLADKLNMTPEEAERWIVNLIRNARLDAKLDSKLVRLYTWIQVNLLSFSLNFFYCIQEQRVLISATCFSLPIKCKVTHVFCFDPLCEIVKALKA